jgi:exonuclease VII large subunit
MMATVTPIDENRLQELRTVANALCEDCRELRELLQKLEAIPDDDIAETYDSQMNRARELRSRVTAAVSLLDRRRRELRAEDRRLPRAIAESLAEARYLLQEMADAYERVLGRVKALMDSVRSDLLSMRKGRKAMRGYLRSSDT